jgi:hypothetical protein
MYGNMSLFEHFLDPDPHQIKIRIRIRMKIRIRIRIQIRIRVINRIRIRINVMRIHNSAFADLLYAQWYVKKCCPGLLTCRGRRRAPL